MPAWYNVLKDTLLSTFTVPFVTRVEKEARCVEIVMMC